MAQINHSVPPVFGYETSDTNADYARKEGGKQNIKSRRITANLLKVVGCVPLIGAVVGIGRIADTIFIMHTKEYNIAPACLAGRIVRGAVEIISLGIIFLPLDSSASIYRKFKGNGDQSPRETENKTNYGHLQSESSEDQQANNKLQNPVQNDNNAPETQKKQESAPPQSQPSENALDVDVIQDLPLENLVQNDDNSHATQKREESAPPPSQPSENALDVDVIQDLPPENPVQNDDNSHATTKGHTWKALKPSHSYDLVAFQSFLRGVYVCSDAPAELSNKFHTGCVLKVSDPYERKKKGNYGNPYAEEIAYKVCKLFGPNWIEIPKTKVCHLSSQNEKSIKYLSTATNIICPDMPLTLTFQAFKQGGLLPGSKEQVNPETKIDICSFQRAFLINWILGRQDARRDNLVYDPTNQTVFEIDNEFIGTKNYSKYGVLRKFEHYMQEELNIEILDAVVNLNESKLSELERKYTNEKEDISKLWLKEGPMAIINPWKNIETNWAILKESIHLMRERGEKITLQTLEAVYTTLR